MPFARGEVAVLPVVGAQHIVQRYVTSVHRSLSPYLVSLLTSCRRSETTKSQSYAYGIAQMQHAIA
jgi:hypothetical protein